MTTEFRVLGPVEVISDCEPVPLEAPKVRTILATLLLSGNRFVSVGRLADALWGDEPPRRARETVHTHIMRLRKLLGTGEDPGPVRTCPGGYLIRTTPQTLDLDRFRELTCRKSRGTSRSDLEREARDLAEANRLWRSRPLDNVESDLLQREAALLVEERMAAVERWIDLRLALGLHHEVIRPLRSLTSEHPLQERFWAQMMTALFRSGRQSEALDAYRRVRQKLADDLGIDPSPALQRLHMAILAGTDVDGPPRPAARPSPLMVPDRPAQAAASPQAAGFPAGGALAVYPVRGCQLPPEATDFTGRADLADQLADALLRTGTVEAPAGAAVCGPPGVGKTALAIRVAHQVQEHFPDGVWFVSLRCFTGRTRPPAEVLVELLRMMGADQATIPAEPWAAAAIYRAWLSGRRVLIVLDGAADPLQVELLLPGTSSCAVLATSRISKPDLAALYGFFPCLLGELDIQESIDLLARIAGAQRVRAEPAAARALAALCGGLPLAIRIAAAHLLARPGQKLADYVGWLRAGSVTAKLSVGPASPISVRASFDSACAALSPPAQNLFRLLGLAPGRYRTLAEAAALLNSAADAELALDELTAAGLLQCRGRAGFALNNLVKRYSQEKLAGMPRAERSAARRRLRVASHPDGHGVIPVPGSWLRVGSA